MARLASDMSEAPMGASVIELGITAALCAPIMLDESVAAFLYLDMRDAGTTQSGAAPDATSFCQAVARLCGLALSSLKRVQMEIRTRKLEYEVNAARAAQLLILPPEQGVVGPLRYAMRVRPGREVAGDLFEAIELDDHRAAICIGDVAGHGVGPGVLMAAALAHLHAALRRDSDPARAVNAVNRFIAHRTKSAKFISMWVGVFDAREHALTFVDAGHGYWMHKPADSDAMRVTYEGGIPVGIDGNHEYHAEHMQLGQRDRLVLYSDGVIEQRNSEGRQFTHSRVAQFIAHDATPEGDVTAVIKAVEEFAGSTELDDDTTVASIQWKD
jgi:serine phosphatase RsbU (regulator of sigma subunit)